MPGQNHWIKTNLELGIDNKNLPFVLELDIKNQINTNFDQASNIASQIIANQYKNLYLGLSGGMDSEYVASVFIRNKIDFTPIAIATEKNINEIWYVKHFCKKHNLKLTLLDYTSKNLELVKKIAYFSYKCSLYPCLSFFPHVMAEFAESQDGFLVTGYGDCFNTSNDYNVLFDDELEIEDHDYYLNLYYGDKHPGAFFSYTPDLWFSLIKNIPTGMNIHVAKEKLYNVAARSKLVNDLELPYFIPDSVKKEKNSKLACIRYSRKKLLSQIQTESKIVLSNQE
jgi:hypothetical protein